MSWPGEFVKVWREAILACLTALEHQTILN